MREKAKIYHCRLITVAPLRVPWPGGRILHHDNLEALLEQLAQMGLHANIGQHAAEDNLVDPPLAKLQNQIVGLWPPHFVRADDNRFTILDIWFEALQPVST